MLGDRVVVRVRGLVLEFGLVLWVGLGLGEKCGGYG